MKKAILLIVSASLILVYLFVIPDESVTIGDENNQVEQYTSIVPAKPPKVPGKDDI